MLADGMSSSLIIRLKNGKNWHNVFKLQVVPSTLTVLTGILPETFHYRTFARASNGKRTSPINCRTDWLDNGAADHPVEASNFPINSHSKRRTFVKILKKEANDSTAGRRSRAAAVLFSKSSRFSPINFPYFDWKRLKHHQYPMKRERGRWKLHSSLLRTFELPMQ